MTKEVKMPYGINTMAIGGLRIQTIKIKLDYEFPVAELPASVKRTKVESKSFRKSGHGGSTQYLQKWVIEYAEIEGKKSNTVVLQIGNLLKKHAYNKFEMKYAWIDSLSARIELEARRSLK